MMCVISITIILLNPEELMKILSPTPTTRKSRGLLVKKKKFHTQPPRENLMVSWSKIKKSQPHPPRDFLMVS